jgi:uncharacterized protein (TIGR03437 family)
VIRNGEASPQITALVEEFAPQIFINSNTGEPIVARPDGSLVTSSAPAREGDILIVYLTGVGGLDNPPATGAAAVASPLASATVTPEVTIGGTAAVVHFAGLTPGFAGLVQINITARGLEAAALREGSPRVLATRPLVVRFGAAASQAVELPVDIPSR